MDRQRSLSVLLAIIFWTLVDAGDIRQLFDRVEANPTTYIVYNNRVKDFNDVHATTSQCRYIAQQCVYSTLVLRRIKSELYI